MIYKALDYGLKENEERELSPPLERLIDMMTNTEDGESDPCPDEGYEATEEEDECEEEEEPVAANSVSSVRSYRDITVVRSHLPVFNAASPRKAIQAVSVLSTHHYCSRPKTINILGQRRSKRPKQLLKMSLLIVAV